jgi:hypothetical protein
MLVERFQLGVLLERTRLGLASNLVAGAGDLLLGLVDCRLGRVGSLASVSQGPRKVCGSEVLTSFSPALVWKSFRIASDMLVVALG